MSYIMTYVAAVPTARRADYEKHASHMASVFKNHGATRVVECWGVDVPTGKETSFPLAVKAGADETVVMGWQEWPDKATHSANFEKAMGDARMKGMSDVPMDGKRLIFAGFETLLDI